MTEPFCSSDEKHSEFRDRRFHAISSGAFLVTICLLIATCSPAAESREFPIDQFKDFINKKGTIERFDFKVLTTKFKIRGLRQDTYRPFTLVFENETKYRLIEDQRDYPITAEVPVAGDRTHTKLQEIQNTFKEFCCSRFEDRFWTTFNPDAVIGASLQSSDGKPTFGPSVWSTSMLGVAYDVLNLGIVSLRDGGVTWDGSRFLCLSNATGRRIEGELLVHDKDVPVSLKYELIENGGRRFRYEVNYEFHGTPNMPEFFPSRLTIAFANQSGRRVVSDYQISRLRLSHRRLGIEDVAFIAPHEITNLVHYVYTNKDVYRMVTDSRASNRLTRIATKAQVAALHALPFNKNKRWMILLILVLTAAAFPLLYRALNRQPNNNPKIERTK